jgi:hypothetical protein
MLSTKSVPSNQPGFVAGRSVCTGPSPLCNRQAEIEMPIKSPSLGAGGGVMGAAQGVFGVCLGI